MRLAVLTLCIPLLSISGWAYQINPDDARLTASLSAAQANLGDPVTFEVQFFVPSTWRPESESPLPPELAKGKVLSQQLVASQGEDPNAPQWTLTAELAWYKLDSFTVPAQTFLFIDENNTRHELDTPELNIEIVQLLQEGDGQLAPNKGQMALPPILILWILLGLIALILILVLAFAIFYFKNREPAPKPPKPLPPPHLEALDALAALTSNTYLKEGKVKEFYVEVALIIRHYYARLYDIHAEEMTSFELEDFFAQRSDLPESFFDLNREFQEMCDRVKFAKYDPLETETKHVVNMAYEIVELLKPKPQPEGGGDDVATR